MMEKGDYFRHDIWQHKYWAYCDKHPLKSMSAFPVTFQIDLFWRYLKRKFQNVNMRYFLYVTVGFGSVFAPLLFGARSNIFLLGHCTADSFHTDLDFPSYYVLVVHAFLQKVASITSRIQGQEG